MTRETAKKFVLPSLVAAMPQPCCPSEFKLTRLEKCRRFVNDIVVWIRNLRALPTRWAYWTLCKSMKNDADYAHAWHCNIAMPIYDASHGEITAAEANRLATVLMKHMFGVKTSQIP